ncbi:MAG: hypothetical protein ING73_10590 [Rhodocyclaceae bacterium]|nr:hypothetical protein [Rhodocyclaceae bacterium]MCA3019362.1 hypothetical protein [Rhodocyclaceae bacterium]MCA3024927.1 hypothetical protein [Rhodocyclaceae bacterium]MCA3032236.1 hypothetical protein [Rhodocyclaceae bacterium]MCA3035938.1 hypothetical protein [Rhodocyclaceae bacterium]
MSAVKSTEFSPVRIKSAEEMRSRPNFKIDIDPKFEKPESVVAHYFLRPMLACGIQGCHQPHNEGLLVRLSTGHETNFGIDCGAKYFGDSFHQLTDEFKQRRLLPQFRQEIAAAQREFLPRSAEIALLDGRAEKLAKMLARLPQKFPKIGEALKKRAERNESEIFAERQRSEDDLERMLALNSSLKRSEVLFERVKTGNIDGLESLQMVSKAFSRVSAQIEEIRGVNAYSLTYAKAQPLVMALDQINDRLAEKERFIRLADKFISAENFEKIRDLKEAVELKVFTHALFVEALLKPPASKSVLATSANDAISEKGRGAESPKTQVAQKPKAGRSMMMQYLPIREEK